MIFFKFLFFLFVGVYLLGQIARLWLRWFVAKKQKEFAQGKNPKGFYYSTNFGGNTSRDTNKTQSKKTGDINIEQLNPQEKKVNNKVGDYVDYEEVK